MKYILLSLIVVIGICFAEGSRENDSLALVAIRSANTYGKQIFGSDSTAPLEDWKSISVVDNRVKRINIGFFYGLDSIPDEFGMLTELDSFSVKHCNLETLPNSFSNCINLEYFAITSNSDLHTIPEVLISLPNIKHIEIRDTVMTTIPVSISSCQTLEVLEIYNSPLSELPDELFELRSLKELRLNNTNLENIPVTIGNFESLERLMLDYNNLTVLPDEIGNIETLKSVDFSNNPLISLPEGIGQLKNLETIWAINCNIESIPQSIGNLASLSGLSLYNNNIDTIPESIKNCSKLVTLSLEKNFLTSLPSFLESLHMLERISFDHNPITALECNFDSLQNLTDIGLDSCNLTEIPDQIWRIPSIDKIDIDGNQIPTISPQISELPFDFYSLSIVDNNLISLPKEVGDLNIGALYLSNNQLETLPVEITKLELSNGRADVGYNYLAEENLAPEVVEWLDRTDSDWRRTQKIKTSINTSTTITHQNQFRISDNMLRLAETTPYSVNIFSVNGRLLKEISGTENVVSLNNLGLANGIYQMRVVQGADVFTGQFILK